MPRFLVGMWSAAFWSLGSRTPGGSSRVSVVRGLMAVSTPRRAWIS